MDNTYVYRKHLRAPFKSYILMVLYFIIMTVLMVLGISYVREYTIDALMIGVILVVVGIMFLIILAEIGLIYIFLINRFKEISVQLTDEGIIYTNSKGQTRIPYEEIEKLEFPSIKYTGGWVKIKYDSGNIRLTVVLEHIGDFISDLKTKLDERNMEHVYNEKKMYSFYKTSIFSDGSWDRLYHNYKFMLAMSYISIISTIAILMLIGNIDIGVMHIYGALFVPLIGYLLSEFLAAKKTNKRVNRESLGLVQSDIKNDTKVENKNLRILMIGFVIGYLILVLVLQLGAAFA